MPGRVVRVLDVGAQRLGDLQVREHVLGGVFEELGGLREPTLEHPGHLVELRHRRGVIGLGEDRAHDRRDGVVGSLGHDREQVPHEVHPAALPGGPMQDLRDRLAEPLVRVGDHESDPLQPSLHERAQERGPELVVLARPGRGTEHGALPGRRHPDRDDGRHGDHPAGLPHLVERRVEPDVGALRLDRAAEEGSDLLVERLADPRDLGAGDPVDPEGPHEVVDLAGGHPLHVGLDDDRVQRLLRPAAGFEERWEVGAGGDLRDLQLDRAHAGVPPAGPVAVAVGGALGAPLVGGGADLVRDLGLHHRLGEHPDAFSERIDVVLLEQLADERRDVHAGRGHRPSSSDRFRLVDEDGGGHLRHGDFHPGSPPRMSTTSRDANSGLRKP